MISLAVDDIIKVLKRFPFLWDEFHHFLQKSGVASNATAVPWGAKGKADPDVPAVPDMTMSNFNRTADTMRFNNINKEMESIEHHLEILSKKYTCLSKGIPYDEVDESSPDQVKQIN